MMQTVLVGDGEVYGRDGEVREPVMDVGDRRMLVRTPTRRYMEPQLFFFHCADE